MQQQADFNKHLENVLQKNKEQRMRIAARINSARGGAGRTNTMSDEDINNSNPALKPIKKKEAKQLKPEKVDFHVKENRENHHTEDYEIIEFEREESKFSNLIVRRGQEFNLTVTFDRPFDAKQDKLILQLTFGPRPIESKKTLIRVKEAKQLSTSSWGMRIDGSKEKTVYLTIMSPANALVGEYWISVETKTKKSASGDEYLTDREEFKETFIVLFNAWCKDDTVYMENDEHRQEYVMNDSGKIWVGSATSNHGKPWIFGQFEDVSLKSCMHILDVSDLNATARGNPILISRAITQMTNMNDHDNGILSGNWSGDYRDGKSPSYWTGSAAILEEYLNNKPKDGVEYGQCWVFSGLVTTLLRAIGIPTRSVTNFESAHDTDASMTIDFHVDKDGEPMEALNDSVWNFHVWNESFFTRPDLPPGYDGWQAIDATPQEASQGVMCCGPCPVRAIKQGEVYLPYDTGFVFAEVNGERVSWEVDEIGEMTVIPPDPKKEKQTVGKNISTKAVGSSNLEDLTDYYKHREGSAAERTAVHYAHKYSSRSKHDIYEEMPTDITFDFVTPDNNLMVGRDFDVKLKMKNTSNEQRTIKYFLNTTMVFYTGRTAAELKKLSGEVVVEPLKEKVVSLPVPASDYLGKTPAETKVKAFYMATVQKKDEKSKEQKSSDMVTFEFTKPTIDFEVNPKEVMENGQFEMTLYFYNPLEIPLENGEFNIQSRYCRTKTPTKEVKTVGPHEKASLTVTFKAAKRGHMAWRYVAATFTSKQLTDVEGEKWFKMSF